jgi:hypothetical protein
MAPRHREGRGRHSGGARPGARSFAAHAPHETRRRPGADTSGSSSLVRADRTEDLPRNDGATLEHAERPAPGRAAEPPTSAGPTSVAEPMDAEAAVSPRPASHSRSGATPAQLRRFIKSRPYVPLHELRRRFGLNGHDDDVVSIELPNRRVWVGLPADEGRMLGELVRQGEVGFELSIDPTSPVVVGVFPIRPVALGRASHSVASTD